jgi:hypothetical protein
MRTLEIFAVVSTLFEGSPISNTHGISSLMTVDRSEGAVVVVFMMPSYVTKISLLITRSSNVIHRFVSRI